jgi:cyclohexyl-isocyanide hydratase
MTTIGILAFPKVTQLDLTGPYEVFSRLPGGTVELVWKTTEPVLSDTGFAITPTRAMADAPQYDVIVVPGGPGQQGLMDDDATLEFLRAQAAGATWVMSVCTGSLVLGAAGLLGGKRATCHWLSLPLLAAFGAEPVAERVVFDGALLSTAGVSAGIDGALALVDRIAGRETAETIQLSIEYDPQPLYSAGSPASAPAAITDRIRGFAAPMLAEREAGVRAAAARLTKGDPAT